MHATMSPHLPAAAKQYVQDGVRTYPIDSLGITKDNTRATPAERAAQVRQEIRVRWGEAAADSYVFE